MVTADGGHGEAGCEAWPRGRLSPQGKSELSVGHNVQTLAKSEHQNGHRNRALHAFSPPRPPGSQRPPHPPPPCIPAGVSFPSDSPRGPCPSFSSPCLRVGVIGHVLLTHKHGLAVHRGCVLVQGQRVRGQLLGLAAARLRRKEEPKGREGRYSAEGVGVVGMGWAFSLLVFWCI